ncbi:MAG: hypothetical protein M3446_01315, partial [Actinomycetota bacterium]|nr:hypothetical protein [Actinomycetota bacterium]
RSLGELDAENLLRAPSAWVFGSEAHGLAVIETEAGGEPGKSVVDEYVSIPIWGRAESLNLAAAAAICLYASATAQRHPRS